MWSRNISKALFLILLVTAVTAVLFPYVTAITETQERTVEDSDGIIYEVSFFESNSTIVVEATNPLDWDEKIVGYSIRVDGQRVRDADFRLDRGEQRTEKINVTPGINVNEDDHTVAFYTYGNSTQFNFTRKINPSDPRDVPTPYISNVEVTTGTIEGETSAVANVTVANPSEQLYSTKLMVHTVETDGSLYPASVRPGDSRTITVELLDDRDAEIAGEARLYTGNLTTDEGGIDQVEFAGAPGSETQAWNASYEPVRPTWMSDNYRYDNDSYRSGLGEKLSRGRDVGGVPVVYPIVGLVVGGLLVRTFR